MQDKSKLIIGVLLLASLIFNVYIVINPQIRQVPVNATDKIVISIDKAGKVGVCWTEW